MAEEPTLPPLPAFTWNSETHSFSNTRKRVRGHATPASSLFNSSDPAVFSSDDDPNVDNYVNGKRRKKRYVGSWYQQYPASGDSTFGDKVRPDQKTERKFQRQFDSGVWMGSDGTDLGDPVMEPAPCKLQQLNLSRPPVSLSLSLSPAEEKARQNITEAIENGEENIDLTGLELEEISNATIAPLVEFACIPTVAEGVPFEQKDPSLKLFLANNPLTRAPGALFNLEFLTVLSLRNAQITEIPPALGNLKNLETLNLSLNRLRYLPAELLDLLTYPGKLRNLLIHPNPFYQPAKKLQNPGFVDSAVGRESAEDLILVLASSTMTPEHRITPLRLWVDKMDYQEDAIEHLRVPDLDLKGWHAQILARSPIQYSDSRGGDLGSKFRLPEPASPESEPTIETEDLTSPPSLPRSIRARASSGSRGRVLSLLELALKSCSQTSQLPLLPSFLPEDAPPYLANLLHRIVAQQNANASTGEIPCSTCRRRVIVPVAQWVEWWALSDIKQERSDLVLLSFFSKPDNGERVVPFMKRACSWSCLPKPTEVGARLPRTLKYSF